jgi:hypothetical protein
MSFPVIASIYGYELIAKLNITEIQAAAILGTMGYLSNGAQPSLREGNTYGPCWARKTIGKGYGWGQWENAISGANDLDNFIDYVLTTYKVDVTKTAATNQHNVSYLINQLNDGDKKSALTALQSATGLQEAVIIFANNYDKPNERNLKIANRINYAKQALMSITNTSVPLRSTGKNVSIEKT